MLEHIAELLDCLRSCNVTLRWLLLHAATRHRKLRPIVAAAAAEPPDALLGLLLDTALVESRVCVPSCSMLSFSCFIHLKKHI